jgi:hypothetical protein
MPGDGGMKKADNLDLLLEVRNEGGMEMPCAYLPLTMNGVCRGTLWRGDGAWNGCSCPGCLALPFQQQEVVALRWCLELVSVKPHPHLS